MPHPTGKMSTETCGAPGREERRHGEAVRRRRGHRRRHPLHRATTSGRAGRRRPTRTGSCTSRSATGSRPGSSTASSSGSPRAAVSSITTARRSRSSTRWTRGMDWVHPGAFDPKARLQVMDECGIHAQVLFPNVVGLGGHRLNNDGPGRGAAPAVHRDLQRRHGRDAGGVEPPLHADARHARVGRRPLREGDRAVRGPRAARAST